MRNDLSKQNLYESVKLILENNAPHLLFNQHKLYTLFSIAFQTMLYNSTKDAGAYVFRIEDSILAEKLARKSKDPSTRKFVQSLLLPRKLKYGKSTFYLDFFHFGTWNLTSEIPKDKLKGAVIIKSTSDKLMEDHHVSSEEEVEVEENINELAGLPKDYYLTSLLESCPKTITIDINLQMPNLETVQFPFIVKEESKTVSGVTLGKDINWDKLDSE